MPLATIKKIDDIRPIEGADSVVQLIIEGWSVVAKLGQFAIGDRCVYIEIDTILPEKPEFDFLASKKYRIKTCKIRKTLSQGIAFPLSILPGDSYNYILEQDVTDIIGVVKYETPIDVSLGGDTKGKFPIYVNKTDETMIQSVKSVIDELRGNNYYIATKIDGTSSTYLYTEKEGYKACSRRLEIGEGGNVYWNIGVKYNLAEKLQKYFEETGIELCIQGEIAGPGIQKNRLMLKEHKLFVFDVFNIKEQKYMGFDQMLAICDEFGLETVPIEEIGTNFPYTLEQMIEYAKGYYNSGKRKEGIVVRPIAEMFSQRLHGRLSFKVINNEFDENENKDE